MKKLKRGRKKGQRIPRQIHSFSNGLHVRRGIVEAMEPGAHVVFFDKKQTSGWVTIKKHLPHSQKWKSEKIFIFNPQTEEIKKAFLYTRLK